MQRIILAFLLSIFVLPSFAAEKESVYERVMGAGKIRCGYVVWEPGIKKDANTGKISGVFYDMMNEVGKRLSLKVDWTEETGWGDAVPGLKSGRFDAVCSHFWATSGRAREVDFSIPLHYTKATVWVRADDTRFDGDLMTLNGNEYKPIFIEGTGEAQLWQTNFPKASFLTMPQLTPIPDMFVAMKSKKGDALISDAYTAQEFLKANPGSIKEIHPDEPLSIYPNVMMLPGGEYRFNQMINNAIRELQLDGTMVNILKKHDVEKFYSPVAVPYVQ